MVSVQTEHKGNLQNVALLRALATFSIVVWHTYCSYTVWNVVDTPANNFYGMLFPRIFPIANMSLFTIIAGYLFCYLMNEKGKYTELKKFVINKAHRLLIPFIVLGTVMNLTQYGKNLVDILYGQPNHLWYCLMLFYCFIICWLVEKKLSWKTNVVLMLLSFIVVGLGTPYLGRLPLGLFQLIYFYGFFYFGYIFRTTSKKRQLQNKVFVSCFLAVYLVFCVNLSKYTQLPLALSHAILTFVLATNICNLKYVKNSKKINSVLNIVSKYSFGIYVLHQWIIWNMTREPHLLAYTKPVLEQHYIIAPIIASTTIFSLCLVMTHFFCKTKIGRYFLL